MLLNNCVYSHGDMIIEFYCDAEGPYFLIRDLETDKVMPGSMSFSLERAKEVARECNSAKKMDKLGII